LILGGLSATGRVTEGLGGGECRDPAASANAGILAGVLPGAFVEYWIGRIRLPNLLPTS
jgi:hypothetical protein